MGALWREPKTAGSMNQALNLVVDAAGKGTNRSRDKAIGMADPLTRSTILYGKTSISSTHNSHGPSLYVPMSHD